MSLPDRNPNKPKLLTTAVLFIAGFGLFMFCRRSDFLPYIPATVVIAPVFILRFSRILPTRPAMAFTVLGFILAVNISLWGIFDMSDPLTGIAFNIVRSSLIGLLYALPYMIDRALVPRLGSGILSTLIFPLAATAVMFLSSLEGPLDGTQAKNVYGIGPLPILQIYALTGLWGFVFLWSWLASLSNHAWTHGAALRPTLAAAFLAGLATGGLYGYGTWRIANAPDTPTVRIASVVMAAGDLHPVSMEKLYTSRKTLPLEPGLAEIETATVEAASQGAQLVAFQEFALVVAEADIPIVKERAARLAADNGVWLALPFAWLPAEGKGENRHLLVDDTGAIRIDHQKRYLFGFGPFGESGAFTKGPGEIRSVESPFGRIAVAICRDASFPPMIRQAGRARAGLMMTGSHDFPVGLLRNDPYRAIENGMTHIRTTFNGISYAVDPYGRLLGEIDNGAGSASVLLVDVPSEGVPTLYARFGDWLGWLSIASVVLFLMAALLSGRATVSPERESP